MSPEHPVEQAIRRSHCAHADRDDPRHQCVGTCHIAPEGITLACRACGDDDRTIASAEILPETRLVRAVLDALGIAYDALAPDYKARAAAVIRRWMESRRSD